MKTFNVHAFINGEKIILAISASNPIGAKSKACKVWRSTYGAEAKIQVQKIKVVK
jgi:hypothetical protein